MMMSEFGRISDLEEKVSKIIEGMKILQRWISIHEDITDDDTKLFDSLNERVTILENQSSASTVKEVEE